MDALGEASCHDSGTAAGREARRAFFLKGEAKTGGRPPLLVFPYARRLLTKVAMLRSAQVKVLNRGALRAARKNAAVFQAARTLATKAASPAVVPSALPRAANLRASARESPRSLSTAITDTLESAVRPREAVGPRLATEGGTSRFRTRARRINPATSRTRSHSLARAP